jgi:hypothetical protein
MDVVAHFKKEEIQAMERLQGGADTEKYGAPYFGKLWEIIQSNPEIKDQTEKAIKELMELPPETAQGLAQEMDQLLDHKLGPKQNLPVPEPKLPVEKELASMGEGGDTEVAFMPAEMLEFFWDLYPDEVPVEDRINEETGLPEFWFFDVVLPFLGGVIGNFIAPGIGGAIGAGLGSAGAGVMHNASAPENEKKGWLDILGNSLMSGGLGYAGGGAMDALKGGKGLGGAASSLFESLGNPLVTGALAGGGLLKSLGGSKVPDSGKNDLTDYNKFMMGARQRDMERINKYNVEASQHRESENKRLAQYEKDLEAHRQQEIANENDYFNRRNETLSKFNSAYHPKLNMDFLQNLMASRGGI